VTPDLLWADLIAYFVFCVVCATPFLACCIVLASRFAPRQSKKVSRSDRRAT